MNETPQERAARIRASRPERQGKQLEALVNDGRKKGEVAVFIFGAALVMLAAGLVILFLIVLPIGV